MFKAFKEFAFRGNVIDLAVGVILGAAFSGIIKSLVDSVFMPLIGIIIGGIDVKGLSIMVGNAKLQYGQFLQASIEFLLIAFALFIFVKGITSFRKKEEVVEEEAVPTTEEKLLTEIRDALIRQNESSPKN
ncbi:MULTISPECIES: large-conductance mechanosensitive channel protein MscL [Exiguobacterium]|uniref:large-conductance mechanosensitive channel protein MscL n=2 Tax=Bacillales Family XII. Incertae Sedis TaxID=539742 RepID=UPI00044F38E7|nr:MULTISPECIES: large-conductance mechanosensitive channel protein MscL [Exiguobacterium]EZP62070.1 Large-conductance mechanosensitive channel [Exiguobacterium sp. RIT341]MDQ6465895.1 large-conductance mechanosensitive channel protein MscL [Exiguobacterium acetylicum]MDT0171389.1 large-conductance mechanosensitive channel protein MscL [Exiguobacterium sp. BRG2]HAZ38906.1 large-conductance mechanosensitive channel protein MscL [Exiguobacterium sp.]HCV53278.1 large-conductance mechanosensitive 